MTNYNRMLGAFRSRLRTLAVALATAGCVVLTAHAVPSEPAPIVEPGVPMKYVVKRGDTLWDIAAYFLRDPWLWPEIWFLNTEVENPHLIYPGDVLYLVWQDGKPRIMRQTTKLSPQIRSTPLEVAIPTIPLDIIAAFLRGPRLVGEEELDRAPFVVDFQEEHLVGSPYDPFYVRFREDDQGLKEYTVVRDKQRIRDPESNELIGIEVIQVANAEKMVDGVEVSKFKPITSYREINKGDALIPVEDQFDPFFTPHAPSAAVDGQIISVHDGDRLLGRYSVVTLNRGSRDGLEAGHVLDVLRHGKLVENPRPAYKRDGVPHGPGGAHRNVTGGEPILLPEEISGQLMVFKTYERISYGLVMTSIRHITVGDIIRTPVPSS